MPVSSTRARVAITAAIIGAAALLSVRSAYEPDLWWHLAQGRETVTGELVRANIFSFTHPQYRQVFTPWLFDAGLYRAWQWGGGAAVQAVQALLLAATFAFLFAASRIRAPASAAIAVLLLGFFAIEARAIPRPHLVSFAGLAACVWLIERARARGRASPLFLAVPLVALWSNLHVECVLGVVLIAGFALAEMAWPVALSRREAFIALSVAGVAGLATMANPYGWGVLYYLYENLAVPGFVEIAELAPPYWPNYRGFFVFLGVAALLLLSQPRRLSVREVALFVLAAALGLRFIRLTPLVVIVTAPMLAARVGALVERGLDRRAVLVTALALAVAASPVPVSRLVTGLRAGSAALTPSAFFSARAVAFIRQEGLSGPLFNSNNLGGYLAWSLYPDGRVFQDSRLQAYPRAHFEGILAASRSQAEWDALVAGVEWAVLSTPRPNSLSGAGRFLPTEWATVFWDEACEILVRRDGRYAGLASAREYRHLRPGSDPFLVAGGLGGADGDRIRDEARRQGLDNPDGYAGLMVLCLAGDAASCPRTNRRDSR